MKNSNLQELIRKTYFILESEGCSKNAPVYLKSNDDFNREISADYGKALAIICQSLACDFNSYQNRVGRRSDLLLREYIKRAIRSQNKVYPPIDLHKLRSKHSDLSFKLAQFKRLLSELKNDPDLWEKVPLQIEDIHDCNQKLVQTAWDGIEKHDKYRYDVWRYKFAKWGFSITIILLIVSNIPTAYLNIKNIISSISSNTRQLSKQP